MLLTSCGAELREMAALNPRHHVSDPCAASLT
jgi:hypothetical protein